MRSDKKNGFARTKIIFGLGIVVVIAGILSFSHVTSNKAELPQDNEVIRAEAGRETNPPASPDADKTADLFNIAKEAESSDNRDSVETGGKKSPVNENLLDGYFDTNSFRIRPKFVGDNSVGIEVQWIRSDSVLRKLGVLKGDVIKSINGMPIKSIEDCKYASNSLLNGFRGSLEIIREDSLIMLIIGERLSILPNERERFGVRPKFEGDFQAKGVEIWRLRDDCVLAKLGLQKKDIIKIIEDTAIQNVGDLVNSIYRGIRKPSFDIKIVRNNEPLAVIYVVEQK
jgi:S1-C subfamily serine protease